MLESSTIIRAAEPSDLEMVIGFAADPALGSIETDRLRRDFADGRMRPHWSWILEVNGVLLGRGLWWGRPDGEEGRRGAPPSSVAD